MKAFLAGSTTLSWVLKVPLGLVPVKAPSVARVPFRVALAKLEVDCQVPAMLAMFTGVV